MQYIDMKFIQVKFYDILLENYRVEKNVCYQILMLYLSFKIRSINVQILTYTLYTTKIEL